MGTFQNPASSNQDPTRAFKIPWHKAQHLSAQTCHGKIQGNFCSGEAVRKPLSGPETPRLLQESLAVRKPLIAATKVP